jgi:cytochrome c oxidase subunit 3
MGIDLEQAVHVGQPPEPPTGHGGTGLLTAKDFRPERSETGVWIGIFAIVMSFAAFTSAMIVRQGASADWIHFQLPRLLFVNTLVLLISSFALGLAHRRLSSVEGLLTTGGNKAKEAYSDGMNWLYCTLGLGTLFVVGQVLAWRVLVSKGILLSSNPSSSFFYVFTAMHGAHLLGGILGLGYMIRKLAKTNGTARTTGMKALCLYWHFMDGLWVYLLIVLMARI